MPLSAARNAPSTVSTLSLNYLQTEAFKALYAATMKTVEDCASYLDGEGRRDRAAMSKENEYHFTRQSMDLTTNAMRTASNLLVWRSVTQGQMSFEDAVREIRRTDITQEIPEYVHGIKAMPTKLLDLIDEMYHLRQQTLRLNRAVIIDDSQSQVNPVHMSLDMIRTSMRPH